MPISGLTGFQSPFSSVSDWNATLGRPVRHFETRVKALDEVLECHLMTGPADYLLRVVVAGLDSYEDFIRNRIHHIGGIASIDTSFVYGTIKNIAVFPPMD